MHLKFSQLKFVQKKSSSSVVPSSPAVNLSPIVPSSSPVSSLPAKSIYDEFADLQIKQVHNLHYNIYITIILSNILITHFLFKNQKFRIQKLLFKLYTYIQFNLVHRMVVSRTLKFQVIGEISKANVI
jgi:hypothetical protein